jgi:NAD-dependent SIR2 family protein deacetylase
MTAKQDYVRAARMAQSCDGLLIGAGAGMGVDSGLPDFRGNEGFWRAYPAFQARGLSFVDMANPHWFEAHPAQAWGFYGHRLNLYRETRPHEGFALLKAWGESRPCGGFVYTSNVDGQFQKAGFDAARIVECHGSIHFLQCTAPCSRDIWPSDDVRLEIDVDMCLAVGELPTCQKCRRIARPNIWMFDDDTWIPDRTALQEQRYRTWLAALQGKRLVAIECGAGTAVATVREECARRTRALIRINPRHTHVEPGGIALKDTALAALHQLSLL